MANSLLDFVMSLVRDPDAAARYTADPAGAIADAHLTDVTSADVNNLIPMVTDSMSMAAPAFGGGDDGNVWTSGAATAAFDAFDAHLPGSAVHDAQAALTGVITQPADIDHPLIDPAPAEPDPLDAPAPVSDGDVEHQQLEHQAPEWGDPGGWEHTGVHDPNADPNADSHPVSEHPGFDLF